MISLAVQLASPVHQARQILEAVAKQVQPILRRRQLTVPLLKEFYPRNGRLLVGELDMWVSK